MDAGFHIILDRLRPWLEDLKQAISIEDAKQRLAALPLQHKKCLLVLSRRSAATATPGTIDQVTKEYPHLSLALIKERRFEISSDLKAEMSALQRSLDAIAALTAPSAKTPASRASAGTLFFQAGYIYPLKDPASYDDHAAGYGFAAISRSAHPGTSPSHDAWIVNERGDVHPGFSSSPVPVRRDDVYIEKGQPLEAELPTPESIFNSPFFGC